MSEDVPMAAHLNEIPVADSPASPPAAAAPEAASTSADVPAKAEDEEDADKPIAPLGTSKKPKSKTSSVANGSGGKKKGGKVSVGGEGKFADGDVVLTKLKGYPPWPSRLVDATKAPAKVMRDRPKGSPYLSQYFPDGSYSWSKLSDLIPLSEKDIELYLSGGSKKVSGDLFKAYTVAQNPTEWIAEREAAEAAAGEEEEVGEEEDELEEEEEEKEKGGKRKRVAESKKESTKAKKAKLENLVNKKKGAKSKATVDDEDDEPSTGPAPKKKAAPKAKKGGKAAEPEPVAAAEEDSDPLANDPEAVKVKEWRHKLQRAFLSGKTLPTTEEMPTYHELFETIEKYEKMSIEYLQHSKIGKVMKKIAALKDIPRNEEYNITKRATDLMTLWHDKVSAAGGSEDKPVSKSAAPNGDSAPATNGDAAKPADDAMQVDDSAAAVPANGDAAPAAVEGQEPVPMETS